MVCCRLCTEFKPNSKDPDCFQNLFQLMQDHINELKFINERQATEIEELKSKDCSKCNEVDDGDHISVSSYNESPPLFSEELFVDDPEPEPVKKEEYRRPIKQEIKTPRKSTTNYRSKRKTALKKENSSVKTQRISSFLIKKNIFDKSIDTTTDEDRTFFQDFEPEKNSSLKLDSFKQKRPCLRPMNNVKKKEPDYNFCDECKSFIDMLNGTMSAADMKKRIQMCEKHKHKKIPLHHTPEGFWDPNFPATPEDKKTQIYYINRK